MPSQTKIILLNRPMCACVHRTAITFIEVINTPEMRRLKTNQHFIVITLLLLISTIQASAQETPLSRQLKESQNLRFVMKPDSADMGLTRWEKKKVHQSRVLPLASDFENLKMKGPGSLNIAKDVTVSGQGSVVIETPASLSVKNPTNRN